MTNAEIIEALRGSIAVLKEVDEDVHDPRLWAVSAALSACSSEIEAAWERESA